MSGFENGYALIIGIANYPQVRKLPKSVLKDARDVYQLLSSPARCGYLASNLKLLLDDQAKANNIRDGLHWLARSAGAGDTAMVFFSGHGGRVESGSQAGNYLIPYDCNPNNLGETAISDKELTSLLRNIKAQRLLVFFDSCYSGGTGETKELAPEHIELKSGLDENYYEQLAQGTGRVIMASSRSDEESLVLRGMDNSLFTHYLLEALQGGSRTRGDGHIRVFDVFDYVSEKVPARGPQHPIFKANDLENNFVIALYLGGKRVDPIADAFADHHPTVGKRALRQAILRAFSDDELDVLLADVEEALAEAGIELPGSLTGVGGESQEKRIHNAIDYLDRRGHLDYLVSVVRRERSGII